MSTVRSVLIAALAVLLVGCSSKFETVTRDEGLAFEGVTIGVMPINYVDKPSVEIISNPLIFVPRLGTLIVAKGKDTKRRKFTNALLEQDYVYQQRLDEELVEALSREGLQVVRLDVRRTRHRQAGRVLEGRFEKNYPDDIDQDVDILLDAYVEFVGYAAESLNAEYLPTFFLAVRLVDARSHDVLYQNRFLYNADSDPESIAATIPADEQFAFETFDDLLADIRRARDGLDQAILTVTDQVANELE